MDIIDILTRADGGRGLDAVGRQFGLDQAQTLEAVRQLGPVIEAGIRRNAQSDDGVVSLFEALQSGGHDRYLGDPNTLDYGEVQADGNAMLGHIFGSKDVSREVALRASQATGIGPAILKQLLPVIATMVMGALAKSLAGGRGGGSGGIGDIIGDVLAGTAQETSRGQRGGSGGGGLGDILGSILGGGRQQGGSGGGGLGDILGSILGGGRQQQASPEDDQQYEQQQRRHEERDPRASGGGSLEDMLREMLGGGAAGGLESGERRYDERAVQRSRDAIDGMLGRGSARGNAADELLNSVERHVQRR